MLENPVVRALAARVRRGGSEPLLTWYHPESGARTELSVRTFANWVDKTANLLDDLGVEGRVAAPLSLARPGHWMSLVWPIAAWQHGSSYLVGEPDADTELVVLGPGDPQPYAGLTTIACSLHPLGLGLRDLPDGVLDFSAEALAQPDVHLVVPTGPAATIWVDAERTVRADAIDPASAACPFVERVRPDRVLVSPTSAWRTLAEAVLGPVLGGGSAVLVDGPVDASELDRIVAAEHAWVPMA